MPDATPNSPALPRAEETRPRVLVIDDEPALLRSTSRALAMHGFEALTAADLEAARNVVGSDPVSAVILDVTLGGADPAAVVAAVHSIAPAAALVLSSGYGAERFDPAALGAQTFLAKPYTLGELVACLESVLAAPRPPQDKPAPS